MRLDLQELKGKIKTTITNDVVGVVNLLVMLDRAQDSMKYWETYLKGVVLEDGKCVNFFVTPEEFSVSVEKIIGFQNESQAMMTDLKARVEHGNS